MKIEDARVYLRPHEHSESRSIKQSCHEGDFGEVKLSRPKVRGECPSFRPCPWVSCKYHLYIDVTPTGKVKINFKDLEPHHLLESCALDVADSQTDRMILADIGIIMGGLTRERIRQIEAEALRKYKAALAEIGVEGE